MKASLYWWSHKYLETDLWAPFSREHCAQYVRLPVRRLTNEAWVLRHVMHKVEIDWQAFCFDMMSVVERVWRGDG